MSGRTLFDYDRTESAALKDAGQDAAATGRADLLTRARRLAIDFALSHGGRCTADDVGRLLRAKGYGGTEAVGPAMGSLFKEKHWRFTGERVRSAKVSNHARELKVWKLDLAELEA